MQVASHQTTEELQRWYVRQGTALVESGLSSLALNRPVLLLDSYERLAALEPWLLGQFASCLSQELAGLPAGAAATAGTTTGTAGGTAAGTAAGTAPAETGTQPAGSGSQAINFL